MQLEQFYHSQHPDISIELFPPKTPEGVEKLFETVEELKTVHPAFFSMTYGAAGSTRDLTIDLCDRLKNKANVEAMCHLNIIGESKESLQNNLKRLKTMNVYNILALRGDPPRDQADFKPHQQGFRSSVELIQEISKDPFFSIAVAGFPEVHPEARDRAADIAYLKRKVEAGGAVIITQLFFDNDFYFDFVAEVRAAGITVPIIPGILPILSVPQIRRFTSLCRATIPPNIEKQLSKYENDEQGAVLYGIELATQMSQELLKNKVPGLHFYALNRSSSVCAIVKNLRLNQ